MLDKLYEKSSTYRIFYHRWLAVFTLYQQILDLVNKKEESNNKIFKKFGLEVLKMQINHMIELLFPAFISALEQYYKSKLIQKLGDKKFIDVYIINKKMYSKVLNKLNIKNEVLDYMLDYGYERNQFTLSSFIMNKKNLNFQDFEKVNDIYQLIFEVKINDPNLINSKIWKDFNAIKECRNIVVHSDGKVTQENYKKVQARIRDINKSVAELFIDWESTNELERLENLIIEELNYIRKLDKHIDKEFS